jgi:hypothetical protein
MPSPQDSATGLPSMENFVLRMLEKVDNMQAGPLLEAVAKELKSQAHAIGRDTDDFMVQTELAGELEALMENLQERGLILDLGGYFEIQPKGRATLQQEHAGSRL